jgi:hypothetical protein
MDIKNGETEQYVKTHMELAVADKTNINYIDTLKNRLKKYSEEIHRRNTKQTIDNDNGAIGMTFICEQAINNGCKIYLSGSGSDEILSDYGFNKVKHYGHSTIGGYFPDDLSSVFPWKNFYGNTQRAYLMKEEYVTGIFGIEGRYPFLDKYVVQEFLWLDCKLKNAHYKAPIYNYLMKSNYPFDYNRKLGFDCGFYNSTTDFTKKTDKELYIHNTPIGTLKTCTLSQTTRTDLVVDFDKLKILIDYANKQGLKI